MPPRKRARTSTGHADDPCDKSTSTAAEPVPLPLPLPLPLAGLVLCLVADRARDLVKPRARARRAGASVSAWMGPGTSALVPLGSGGNSVVSQLQAACGGVPVWTRDEFEHACASGEFPHDAASRPTPDWAAAIAAADSPVPLEWRSALVGTLQLQFDQAGDGREMRLAAMHRPWETVALSGRPHVADYGAGVLAEFIKRAPVTVLNFDRERVRPEDMEAILGALEARSEDMPVVWRLSFTETEMGDDCAAVLAAHMKERIRGLLYVRADSCALTEQGVALLLDAVPESLVQLHIHHNAVDRERSDDLVKEWKLNGVGASRECEVI